MEMFIKEKKEEEKFEVNLFHEINGEFRKEKIIAIVKKD